MAVLKKYLSIFLICILVIVNSTISFADIKVNDFDIVNGENHYKITEIEYEVNMTKEGIIENGSYKLNGDKVTYTRKVEYNGITEIVFNEANKIDKYIYDSIENKFYENGKLLDMEMELVESKNVKEDEMGQLTMTTDGYKWRYVTSYDGSNRFEITTLTAVAAALSAFFGGPVGAFLVAASIFVGDYANEYLLVYFTKIKYEATNPGIYPYVWKFKADFFEDKSHRYFIESSEWLEFALLP